MLKKSGRSTLFVSPASLLAAASASALMSSAQHHSQAHQDWNPATSPADNSCKQQLRYLSLLSGRLSASFGHHTCWNTKTHAGCMSHQCCLASQICARKAQQSPLSPLRQPQSCSAHLKPPDPPSLQTSAPQTWPRHHWDPPPPAALRPPSKIPFGALVCSALQPPKLPPSAHPRLRQLPEDPPPQDPGHNPLGARCPPGNPTN